MHKQIEQLRIVLIEDSADLASTLEEALTLDGHQVKSYLLARSAFEDPNVIQSADLLVTDYYLTDLNGMEVIQQARSVKPSLPIILLSGAREPTVLEALRTLPMTRFLPKPVDLNELEKRIRELLHLSNAA